ncbi:MAG: SDR family oxidoreductase, partial [Bacteroidota bacterium]
IGAAVTRRLTQQGAQVVIAERGEDRLHALAKETGATPHALDATQYEEVQALVKQTTSQYGTLSGVANFIGSILLKPAHLTSVDEYTETIALNLNTSFFLVKAAARAMMKGGGAIVLSSSAVGRTGLVNHEAIAAAKAGVIGLTQSAAATYANRGIRVNCVAPGLVETPMTTRITGNDAGRKQSESMHALGRIGQPDDVAEAVTWLLDGTRSSWVTGQVIGVDGGLGTVRPR